MVVPWGRHMFRGNSVLLCLALAALLITPSAASLRGARHLDRELMAVRFDKDDEDGGKRLGALVVDVTEERVSLVDRLVLVFGC